MEGVAIMNIWWSTTFCQAHSYSEPLDQLLLTQEESNWPGIFIIGLMYQKLLYIGKLKYPSYYRKSVKNTNWLHFWIWKFWCGFGKINIDVRNNNHYSVWTPITWDRTYSGIWKCSGDFWSLMITRSLVYSNTVASHHSKQNSSWTYIVLVWLHDPLA